MPLSEIICGKNVCKIISGLQQGSRLEGKLMRRDNKQIVGPISLKLQLCNFTKSCIFNDSDVKHAQMFKGPFILCFAIL